MDIGGRETPALARLNRAIDDHRASLEGYRRDDEKLLFETLRAIDHLYCRELFEARKLEGSDAVYRTISSWGVNEALARVMPRVLEPRLFSVFPSHARIQDQVDEFLFDCGRLQLGQRLSDWVWEGVADATLRVFDDVDGSGPTEVLELTTVSDSHFDEQIGRAGIRWASDRTTARLRPQERELSAEHKRLLSNLEKRVFSFAGWGIDYSTSSEIDAHFHEWAKIYLARIHSQDLIGPDELIGGRPFSRYVEVLTALSAHAHRHMAFASILHKRDRTLDLRNLLTTSVGYENFTVDLARSMNADREEIESILSHLTLGPDNVDAHVGAEATVWAPAVRSATNTLVLPLYGLEINPFLFLLNDLRRRYTSDWDVLANAREARWVKEMAPMFEPPRWRIHTANLRLRENGRDLTDLDFVALDERDNELTIFQLKWQQPVANDERARRSASSNLLKECNSWIEKVHGWLDRHGVPELMRRLGFPTKGPSPKIRLVVLGRYAAYYTGHGWRDPRATWSDWANFLKARAQPGPRALSRTLTVLNRDIKRMRSKKTLGRYYLPVGELAVVLNAERTPTAPSSTKGGPVAESDDA